MEALKFVWQSLWQHTARAGAIRLIVAVTTLASALVLLALRFLAAHNVPLEPETLRTMDVAIELLAVLLALEVGLGAIVVELLRLEEAKPDDDPH